LVIWHPEGGKESVKKRLLVLAPHTDDGEFGCGGTVTKLINEGWEAHYVAFSDCADSLPAGLPADTLVQEVVAATRILGVAPQHLQVLRFRVRRFPELRQEILEEMIRIRSDVKPEIVFLPSRSDTHQDHQQICEEGFRAFKMTCLLGYEMPWNNIEFRTTAFSVLREEHVQTKIEALQCYQSQAHRPYVNAEFLRSLARIRGVQIGVGFAEAFELFRWIL
jgi:LmbE family N-acetylglucosaminyl deacetylase